MSIKVIAFILILSLALIPLARLLAPSNNPGRAIKIITYTLGITWVLIIICFIILMIINNYRSDLAKMQGREFNNEAMGVIGGVTLYFEIYIFLIIIITADFINKELNRSSAILLTIIFLIIAVIPNLLIAGVWVALAITEGIRVAHSI